MKEQEAMNECDLKVEGDSLGLAGLWSAPLIRLHVIAGAVH